MAEYLVVDVEGWEVLGIEQMGSKPDKFWIEAPPDAPVEKRRWLFKPVTTQHERGRDYAKGDDWAEKVAAEVAVYLGVPAAPVELATRQGVPGIISGDISRGRTLVLGNEVLFGHDPDYDLHRRRGVPGYTVDAVFSALRALRVEPPPSATVDDARSVFSSYLLLDALVANTDRHHENWGVLVSGVDERVPQLAPTFDHASCLGFQLPDDEREERLQTRDVNRTVAGYAERGRSRHFAGLPTLVSLALDALSACPPDERKIYWQRLAALEETQIEAIVATVPDARMSQLGRIFAVRVMQENRRRLLYGLNDAF